MAQLYKRVPGSRSETRFNAAPTVEPEHSFVTGSPRTLTTMRASEIVPIRTIPVLPNMSIRCKVDEVIRQVTMLKPTMGEAFCDVYAFFVPHRIINESFVNVMGENTSDAWTASEVTLAPLYKNFSQATQTVAIPPESVADYYLLPTQQAMPANVLNAMNDLKFRGYLMIYNEYFRNENYQAPIPFSTLNVYEGFLEPVGSNVYLNGSGPFPVTTPFEPDGSYPAGAIVKAVYGEGAQVGTGSGNLPGRISAWSALDRPLKANKLNDYFTSTLPSPQKGDQIVFALAGSAPVSVSSPSSVLGGPASIYSSLGLNFDFSEKPENAGHLVISDPSGASSQVVVDTNPNYPKLNAINGDSFSLSLSSVSGLSADLSDATGISLSDLRDGIAVQHVYEQLARAGSRYLEFVSAFFGIESADPYCDIPKRLGRVRRSLDIYQTAQTSASVENGTAQGNLAAYGYTSAGGDLFHETFLEYGNVHILAVIRHRNSYASFMQRDDFRRSMLDFYNPLLSNLTEMPVYTREINPFAETATVPGNYQPKVFGYQEAWADYRMHPDIITGLMRPGVAGSLDVWNYGDPFDPSLQINEASWQLANTDAVVARTLSVQDEEATQFYAFFKFQLDVELPMPVYDIPGLDTI